MQEIVPLLFNGIDYNVKRKEYNKIGDENLKTITQYDLNNKRDGLSTGTREGHLQLTIMLAKYFHKPFNQISSNDIIKFADELNVSNITKKQYIIQIRKFFKWFNEDIIKDLKVPKAKNKRKKFSDKLSEEEIQKLIDSYPEPNNKALVSVLYDSACRVGEIVNLKRRDVVCNDGQWIISVEGKTGVRNIPLMFSPIYLEPWFNQYHPDKENPDAPLFVSMSRRTKYEKIEKRRLGVTAVWFILKQGERASGIKKKIHPHLLRHSRLTWLSDHGMSENMMRIYAGWEDGSPMPGEYLHTNPKEITKTMNNIYGKSIEEKPEFPKLIPKECPRCKTQNDASSKYCRNCWLPLNIKVASKEMMILEFLRSELYQNDKEILQEYPLEMLSEKYNQLLQDQKMPGRKQVTI